MTSSGGYVKKNYEMHWLKRTGSAAIHTSEEGNRTWQWQHCEDNNGAKSQPVRGNRVVLQSVPLEQEVVAFLQK